MNKREAERAKQKPQIAAPAPAKRALFSQSDIPIYTLEEALRVARALHDNYAGGPESPHNVAIACDLSPTGSHWRMLAGAALAYGLTTGSFSADKVSLTPVGDRIVAPKEEGDDARALIEAALKPKMLREFYTKYDKNKFPRDEIAKNVLVGMGVPQDRVESYLAILRKNGQACGIIRDTKTGPFVALEVQGLHSAPSGHPRIPEPKDQEEAFDGFVPQVGPESIVVPEGMPAVPLEINNKVFISHGKNRKVVEQLRQILSYGGFQPVIAQETETTSKPVPEKVMEAMRASSFAVIHVSPERELMDESGERFVLVNQNVLIEIGASMALHKNRFVLLVEEGVKLPSNLQGMYECRYTGDSLDFEATMRLLKAFNEFKSSG